MVDFILTRHLRERYVQRTNKKYHHLRQCCLINCPICFTLTAQSKQEADLNYIALDQEIQNCLLQAEECRGCINNSKFMASYYEKYGFDNRFQFLVYDGMLYVVVVEQGRHIVVTCIRAKTHVAGKQTLRPKFKKRKLLDGSTQFS